MKLKPAILAIAISAWFGAHLTAAPVSDDFTGGLGNWTKTVILDNAGAGNNTADFQVNELDQLELNTTAQNGIDQYAYIYTGAFLDVGEEAQVDITHPLTGNRNLGLYVGGTAPVGAEFPDTADTRSDNITNYASATGAIATRGQDGSTEYNNTQALGLEGVTTLFIARTDTNTFDVGYYIGSERTVYQTRNPVTPNAADFVGIYADARAVGIIQAISAFRIIVPPYLVAIDNTNFQSGLSNGDLVGILSASIGGEPNPSTFSLVAGAGDTDNALFQIGGGTSDELEINANFTATGLDPANGTQYFIRVRGDSEGSSEFEETELVLTVSKDDDLDNLQDDWELKWALNLTDLSGVTGTEDFDNDELWDIEEYQLSIGTYPNFPTFANIDPTKEDTDGDTLLDGEEIINLVGARPATNPTEMDTDFDGLTDFEETNSGVAEVLPAVGTNPAFADFDGDGSKDGFEVENGTNPMDDLSHPNSVAPSVTVTRITDDASSEISSTKTYTHAVSGGAAATVNGVAFSILDATNNATNFDWAPDGGQMESAVSIGTDWDPAIGGVTGTEVIDLLTGFTFSGSSANPGGKQIYTLSGLTSGNTYALRLYIRQWRNADSGRPIDLTFINGAEMITPYCALMVDRPGYVLNDATLNHDQAYFINYAYTAQGTDLVVEAQLPFGFGAANDSFHLYGLTNELAGPPATALVITGVARNGSGQIVIDFTGPANETFTVTKSADLQDGFGTTAATVGPVTTNAVGIGQAVITAAEASEPAEFYRIEN